MSKINKVILPRENNKLFGHEDVEKRILKAHKLGRLHHSIILSGPRGIGKETLAYRLARYLLSNERYGTYSEDSGGNINSHLSPDSSIFRQISSGGHISCKIIERNRDDSSGKLASEITIEDIRKLSAFYRLTSMDGNWRVSIINIAEEMNRNASNALLKLLEEPPPRSTIILVTHTLGRLLPTIRSRCNIIKMTALNLRDMDLALKALGISIDKENLVLLTGLCGGSVGNAVQLLKINGLELYSEIVQLITRKGPVFNQQLDEFSDKLTRKGQEEKFQLFTQLIERAICEIILDSARNSSSSGVSVVLEHWLEVWEKVRVIFEQENSLNLDRKHVILNAFMYISRTAQNISVKK